MRASSTKRCGRCAGKIAAGTEKLRAEIKQTVRKLSDFQSRRWIRGLAIHLAFSDSACQDIPSASLIHGQQMRFQCCRSILIPQLLSLRPHPRSDPHRSLPPRPNHPVCPLPISQLEAEVEKSSLTMLVQNSKGLLRDSQSWVE